MDVEPDLIFDQCTIADKPLVIFAE